MPELRDLPSVDALLKSGALDAQIGRYGEAAVKTRIRALQQQMREARSVPEWAVAAEGYARALDTRLRGAAYTPVFNLTGTIIHTNLGRALLSPALWHDIEALVTRPMNLEYDLQAGRRGDRDGLIEQKLTLLTGAEAATVVNNNAAALLLVLNTLALGKEVPVSRGELIEIGGSFRLPELMTRSGCSLREIGTTNRTHLKDYQQALPTAAMLLKVHQSNYAITGFSRQVESSELAELARQAGIPFCVDLGSGTLVDLRKWGLPYEPTPQETLKAGAHLITFSGDKLLGAVQAGIIVGDRALITQLKRNPLKRALRADKITLAALYASLCLYESPDQLAEKLPLLKTLTTPLPALEQRAARIAALLGEVLNDCAVTVEDSDVQIGSGALPDRTIASKAVAVRAGGRRLEALADQLRRLDTPVIGRIQENALWLDARGAELIDELLDTLRGLTRADSVADS